ncbi:WD40 repeat-like protein [Teratosphaeria nubilosa]|uniref:WD40 repeat-like protein n=1 Tax=Teratosphaeria nubilosa TaxID=161662 RepID=A0A6G1KWJ6_9PEZI|nr:WD40 repeat-like protein [Teratosphaeria nubilosa]
MDPARAHAAGLGVSKSTSVVAENPLSTAPASPTDEPPNPIDAARETTTTTTYDMPPPNTTVGSFSYGPAIQKTTTTVTTTTTISLPPIAIKPPSDLHERDPRQYPLAFTPTPHQFKHITYNCNGRPTSFFEADDPKETTRRWHEQHAKLSKHNGSLSTVTRQENYETPTRSGKESGQSVGKEGSGSLKRTATPVSISEAAELASQERRVKKPRSTLERTLSEKAEIRALNQFKPPSTLSPVTPGTEHGEMSLLPPKAGSSRPDVKRKKDKARLSQSKLREVQDGDVQMEENEEQEEESQNGPPFYGRHGKKKRGLGDTSAVGGADQSAAVATPTADVDYEPVRTDSRRPRPPSIVTSSQQDASLPSPSLSPITAAANAANRNRNAFEDSFAEHIEENGGKEERTCLIPPQKPTVQDIPAMVKAFDSMAPDMQSWVMYQFLRRCAKPTLQMVAGVVNPALKCDPFNVLPPELGLNIARFLDAPSMCRAAQVSRRWRQLVNSNETAWKDLLDRDDFVLPDGEIARAVKEGWGWQNPGINGWERDLSKTLRKTTPEPVVASVPASTYVSDDDDEGSSRLRRKANGKHSSAKKFKRRSAQASSSATKPTTLAPWRRTFASAKGPNGYAEAAAEAVPETGEHPAVGLPSLKNMHLFKALYQRHYLIRKAWMQEESKPMHLAFRAHHRHVVTCLLFDSDKILTGSDDTKINVYDTKTGALRTRLEGHEGGVWALQYDGNTLVSGSTDRSVRVWDIETGRCLQVFQGHTSTVRCLVILRPVEIGKEQDGSPIMMPKEPLIITGSRDSTLRVWKLPQPGDRAVFQAGPPANDRENPYFLRTLSGHHNSVRAIAAHGDTLVSGSYDCTVRVWKISTGELTYRLQGHTQKVYSVVLDHARDRCISGSMDNLVKVWDLPSGTCLFNLEGHTSLVGLLDLSHDRLVSAAADSTLRIWDPETGVCKATLSAHTGAITCFQHDGQKVISGSDRTLKMWNVKNGDCVRDLLTDLSGVWQVRFDERRCVAAVQRNNLTYIEVLDFGAARDGEKPRRLGRRIVVNARGHEIDDVEAPAPPAAEPAVDADV